MTEKGQIKGVEGRKIEGRKISESEVGKIFLPPFFYPEHRLISPSGIDWVIEPAGGLILAKE